MKVVSILNQKGGVGKTTLSINLAAALKALNHSVLLVDADPQGSSLDWAAAREPAEPLFSVVSCPKPTIHKTVTDIGVGKDFVIIDGAPRVTDLARSCIMASDLVLIPVQPSPYDIWASQEVVKLIQEAVIYKPELKAAFVINRKIPNTAIGRDVESALAEFDLPVLSTTIGQRVIFAESAAGGLSVLEQDAKSQAAVEISLFAKDVLNLLEKK
jgi:chromosome partitioning protein